ncbi:MAG: S1C family serine protease [candidate division KSB1 bacterium]|nr:S1C family serine protease [candidate division KSB1 bacterium]MDZ7366790.1 S1C family serine protease [candidate division KSB1 bacterium]MDZ7405203.1 S1C family serine protease [candidate division KSB1 bacterium]
MSRRLKQNENCRIGFAILINMAKQVMDELVSKDKVARGYTR